jgi:hypothetical protein
VQSYLLNDHHHRKWLEIQKEFDLNSFNMHRSKDSAQLSLRKQIIKVITIKYLHENAVWRFSFSKYHNFETQSNWYNLPLIIKTGAINK